MTTEIIINQQPAENQDLDPRGLLQVTKIFDTMQGEGPFIGMASVFVRLAGCNLQCPMCDAEYTTRKLMNPGKIVDEIQKYYKLCLVVLTGGEPFRQNITPLVKLLINTGFSVQIETNGCYYLDDFPYSKVTIVCSPKTPKINPDIPVHYYKYVLDKDHISDEDGLPTSVLGMPHPPARPRPHEQDVRIFVQPADAQDESKTMENIAFTWDVARRFGYRYSPQLQKYLGLE